MSETNRVPEVTAKEVFDDLVLGLTEVDLNEVRSNLNHPAIRNFADSVVANMRLYDEAPSRKARLPFTHDKAYYSMLKNVMVQQKEMTFDLMMACSREDFNSFESLTGKIYAEVAKRLGRSPVEKQASYVDPKVAKILSRTSSTAWDVIPERGVPTPISNATRRALHGSKPKRRSGENVTSD